MSKIHVLPDENLCGGPNGQILREYVEVNRRANVRDYVYFNDDIDTPEYLKVTGYNHNIDYYKVEHDPNEWGATVEVSYEACRTLEPTDIVHIDGKRYRLVDRKAKVGEKVIVVEGFAYGKVGEIHTINEVYRDVYTTDKASIMRFGRCLVLEPAEPAEEDDDVLTVDETEASKSVIDLLANLARRVTELERKLEREGEFRESLYRKISDMKDDIEMALDDIVTLDERTQSLVKPFGEESPFATVATIPTFKFSELIGKTLKIYGGRDGEYAMVFGYDESTGNSYVLFSGKEGGESR
jgi:hypothetical protein